ncbi:alcohol-forming fatty acyl-CoA reductase-like isoform X2 [Triticum dicoccoides]|uniref:alcohol-forming fatty acyl-CoA reductase-like isoform X2 n=1 Tax=Triticum dicoccoides TaxID=85692 RepID=UPI00188E7B31|nr:alcohol-forming fatty acyl-CoA reductase-like isoform X2 [Triticum dicoccoides]
MRQTDPMVIGGMNVGCVASYFGGKNILITGSTGFLGKVLVEKILRVQPGVRKVFLLVRATNDESARHRIQTEVTRREIFQVLREKYGNGFGDFIQEKVCPLAGDVICEDFGLDTAKLKELSKNMDIIVNGAATTNFYERYDVAFDTNVLGAKHMYAFANKCIKLKMLLHISTAYVSGEQEGLILEKPFIMGDTLRAGTHLDVESELNLIKHTKMELNANCATERAERKTMKELGLKRARHFGWPNTYVFTKAMGEMLLGHLEGDLPVVIVRPSIITSILKDPLPGWIEGVRTIDSVILGYTKQALKFFLVDPDAIMDVIPGDMVVNSMMVAMAAHTEEKVQTVYHLTSSVSNPTSYTTLQESGHRYFKDNPPRGENGEPIRLNNMRFFSTVVRLRAYIVIKYKFPLEVLHLVNVLLCGLFSRRYNELNGKYRLAMHLIELYAPYTLFKGRFDDMNLEKLRKAMESNRDGGEYCFDFDLRRIDWDDYFYRVHFPGVLKYLA